MKRFFLTFGLALVLFASNGCLSSCSKDEPEEVTPDSPETPDVQISDQRIIGTWVGSFYDDTFTLKFSSDGKLTETIDGETDTYSFSLKGSKLIIKPEAVINNILGPEIEVSFSGSKMILACEFYSIEFRKK